MVFQVLMVPPHMKCLHVLYDSYGPPHTCYGIGIIWSPYMYHVCVVPLHVLYDSYGTLYLIWNRYHIVPPHVHMVPPTFEVSSCLIWLLWSPHTLHKIGMVWFHPHIHMASCMYIWSPHMYDMMPMSLMVPHTLYEIGLWWSPLPYIDQVSCGLSTCTYGPPYIYNLMVPLPYMEQVSYGTPHVGYDFFRTASKEVHCLS